MKIRYFILLFSLTLLFAGVSFASTLTDPMIIFGNSPAGTPLSACASDSCETALGTFATPFSDGITFPGSTPPEDSTSPSPLLFFNDTGLTVETFTVHVQTPTPFLPPLSCEVTNSAITSGTFDTGTPSSDSCTFSFTGGLRSLTPGESFDVQFVNFTDMSGTPFSSLLYDFRTTTSSPVPEPNTFVLFGSGLTAALLVGRKRMKSVKPTWAS